MTNVDNISENMIDLPKINSLYYLLELSCWLDIQWVISIDFYLVINNISFVWLHGFSSQINWYVLSDANHTIELQRYCFRLHTRMNTLLYLILNCLPIFLSITKYIIKERKCNYIDVTSHYKNERSDYYSFRYS